MTPVINEQQTSVADEDAELGPFRGTPVYMAAKGVEQSVKSLPDVWGEWRDLLEMTDEYHPTSFSKKQIRGGYRMLQLLRKWGRLRLRRIKGITDPITLKGSSTFRTGDFFKGLQTA